MLHRLLLVDAQRLDWPVVVQDLGKKLNKTRLGSERDLSLYQARAVETPVTSVFEILQEYYSEKAEDLGLDVGTDFGFENHLNVLHPTDRVPVDGACIVRDGAGDLRMILCVEYKAPHKVTVQKFKDGLKEMKVEDIMNRAEVPPTSDKNAVSIHQAEELVAAVLVQTYDYMVKCGVR